MSKLFIEEQTLTSIGNAIRSKTGKTDLISPAAMAGEIEGISGGGDLPEDALTYTGDLSDYFKKGRFFWLIRDYGNRLKFNDVYNAEQMFYYYTSSTMPLFTLNFVINLTTDKNNKGADVSSMFSTNYKIIKPPYLIGPIGDSSAIFYNCYNLNEIPEDWANRIDWSYIHSNFYYIGGWFNHCQSLKHIPQNLIDNLWCYMDSNSSTYGSNLLYRSTFDSCYVLDELTNLPVIFHPTKKIDSTLFYQSFTTCHRLKRLTFKTNEDGTSIVCKWTGQTIDLTDEVGAAPFDSDFIGYNSGLTKATKITDQASYEALKDNPDNWTTNFRYSRYNHDSAVETINSLPDCSAYLATEGGTNTIKFNGAYGSLTDGGAINTLTPEEIAVATAKGWTVSLV